MKKMFMGLFMASITLPALAQSDDILLASLNNENIGTGYSSDYIPVMKYWKDHDIFSHLDLSLTAGSTGIGLDLASPVGDYLQVRAGYEFMPHFKQSMKFDMTLKGKPVRQYDQDGNRVETTFDKLKEFLYQMTGYDVEDHADMVGKPTMNNVKLLVDVFPFKKNKHWHFTAGFYWGPSKFAYAENSTGTMVSLISAGMYNRMYDKALSGEPFIDFSQFTDLKNVRYDMPEELMTKFKNFGRMGFSVGKYTSDLDIDGDGVINPELGEHAAGDRYVIEPDDDGMVRVEARSKSFKPYLGFGYGGSLSKKSDEWHLSFDCGALFWGGAPDLYVHDGTNLTKDVDNINGRIGDYVKVFKVFSVYPVLSVRLTKRLF